MTPVLEVTDLTMRFGSIAAAESENVTVHSGEFVGIVGPNGAGKTTFLNLVTGYLRPQAGRVKFCGRDILGLRPEEITALGIGRSFQIPQLFLTLTVLENLLVALACAERRSLDFWRPLWQTDRIRAAQQVLGQFGLEADADRPASELPEGGRKLLDIALAFALRPTLLLMDEPTSGVSAQEKFAVMDRLVAVLREGSVTAIFVEHDMEVVRRYADRVLVLDNGRIVAEGPPALVLGGEAAQQAARPG
ncbi:MAG: ABC transporter ATP-binding protein [Armatimonadota bacterium]|nr:ABC transporter ATP-binding protein [Armatimonadota bacterium]MDR5697770.1 ABC transporter ATP-binding protein [Armatimonadota bacterium]